MIPTFVSRMLFRGPQQPQVQRQEQQQEQYDQHTAGQQSNLTSRPAAYLASSVIIPSRRQNSEKCVKTPHSRRLWPTKAKSSAVTKVSSCVPGQQRQSTTALDSAANPIKLSLIRATNFNNSALAADESNACKHPESSSKAILPLLKMDDRSGNDKTRPKEVGSELANATNIVQNEDAYHSPSASAPGSVSCASSVCSPSPPPPPESAVDASNPSQNTEQSPAHGEQAGQARMSWLAWIVQPRSTDTSVDDDAPTQAMRESEADNAPPTNLANDSDISIDAQGSKETDAKVHAATDETPRETEVGAQANTSWLQEWTRVAFASPALMRQQEPSGDSCSGSQESGTAVHSEELTGGAEGVAACDTTDEHFTGSTQSYWKSAWFLWTREKSSNAQDIATPKSVMTSRNDANTPAAGEQWSSSPMEAATKGDGGPVALPPGVTPDKVANAKKPITGLRAKKDDGTTVALVPPPLHNPNQVLPSIRETFKVQKRPGLLQQIAQMFMPSRWDSSNHVCLTQEPPLIRHAVAIGVHGYFPVQILRKVLGPPTGTSVKFATMAAKAISQWAEDHGTHCTVTTIPLEGEGRIAERVELLWNALLSYIDEIRNTDFVLVACHSQGVPVATMLVSKLIDLGCIGPAQIGICAMAGINSGPFVDYRSRLIGGAAGELFEFLNPATTVSQAYATAVEHVLSAGSRITYIGSIDDQLVPLEVCGIIRPTRSRCIFCEANVRVSQSSVFSSISHPYIYRAVFVNGRVHAPSL
ncbi:hypothetical protein KEM54_006328 [Ascosphaera aggregata]|nr:hypothetical protein KEM54_006328 [Ascosphaera aggregata]